MSSARRPRRQTLCAAVFFRRQSQIRLQMQKITENKNKNLADEDKVVEVKQGAAALPAGFNAAPRRDGNSSRSYTSLNSETCRLFTSYFSCLHQQDRHRTTSFLAALPRFCSRHQPQRWQPADLSRLLISASKQAVAVIRHVKCLSQTEWILMFSGAANGQYEIMGDGKPGSVESDSSVNVVGV